MSVCCNKISVIRPQLSTNFLSFHSAHKVSFVRSFVRSFSIFLPSFLPAAETHTPIDTYMTYIPALTCEYIARHRCHRGHYSLRRGGRCSQQTTSPSSFVLFGRQVCLSSVQTMLHEQKNCRGNFKHRKAGAPAAVVDEDDGNFNQPRRRWLLPTTTCADTVGG